MATTSIRRSVPKEMYEAVEAAVELGWEAEITNSNHLRLTHPKFGKVTASTTPTNAEEARRHLSRDITLRMMAAHDTATHMALKEQDLEWEDAHGKGVRQAIPCWACQVEGLKPKTFTHHVGLARHVRKDHRALLEGDAPEPEDDSPMEESIEDKVVNTMRTFAGEEMRAADVAELASLKRVQVKNALDRLAKKDSNITRIASGVYRYGEPMPAAPPLKNFDAETDQKPGTDRKPTKVKTIEENPAPANSLVLTRVAETTTGAIVAKADDGSVWLCERL